MATVISGTTGISANAVQFLIGQVVFMAGANAPSGFLKCNGQLVSRTTYARLFAVIGTTYGAGDGSTTFAVPDLRGEFLRGWDDGRGVDAGRGIGSSQADEMKSHQHTQNIFDASLSGGNNGYPPSGGNNFISARGTSLVGGTETRPRNVALLACIFSGV